MGRISQSAFFLSFLVVAGCGDSFHSAKHIAQKSLDSVGCKASQSEMWNSFHRVAEEGGKYPSSSQVRQALLQIGQQKNLTGAAFTHYVDTFVSTYETTLAGIQSKFAPTNLSAWKKALAEMEIGVRVTEVHAELQGKIESSLQSLARAEKELGTDCAQPEPEPQPMPPKDDDSTSFATVWEQLKAQASPEVYGARLTLATAYQSCDVLSLTPMTAYTPNVDGIVVIGNHPSGTGKKRDISSVASVNSTHYYIKNNRLAKNSCFEIRNSPLIYDYGGKPFTSSQAPLIFDLHREMPGDSGPTLGIDCSAYVFSALAVAGLKMDPSATKPLKADLVHGIGSRAFKEPQANGLRCLEKIEVSADKSILPGDIVAINGHVVMVDQVGDDPFGIDGIQDGASCTAANIPISRFDFIIAQSSPVKNGIGINRYRAKDYLTTSNTFKDGLTRYAVAACRARFGLSHSVDTTSLSVVRHKKTADCRAPAPLSAAHEECVDSCRPL
jgi:hypothetical protein